jgi:general secretion pathway protein I
MARLRRADRPRGFTLIEVLVALAIVAIALLAALRAAGQSTAYSADSRSRLLASWVAQNQLAEHRARGDWLPLGTRRGNAQQGGFQFLWREDVSAMPHPAFRRVDIYVYADGDATHTAARLIGFIVEPGVIGQ